MSYMFTFCFKLKELKLKNFNNNRELIKKLKTGYKNIIVK